MGDKILYRCRQLFEGIEIYRMKLLDIGGGDGAYSRYALHTTIVDPKTNNTTFQDYETPITFDIALSHNSINHLDQWACIELIASKGATKVYLDIFKKVYRLLTNDGIFIISDAGRINYWDNIGLRSPVARSVNFRCHQEPERWIEIAHVAGFKTYSVKCPKPYHLRWFPLWNRTLARLTNSQFILTLWK